MRVRAILGILAAAGLAAALPTHEAHSQVALGVRASTLGLGGEVSYRLNGRVGLRGGVNYFSLTVERTVEGVIYDVKPKLTNGTAIVDLYPLGGSFHFSAGALLNGNEGRLTAQLAGPITIGARTYTPPEVGSLIGTVDFNSLAPYLGLGFGGGGRVAFLFDLGVGITGTPKVDLVGQTSLTGAERAEFEANVAAELAQVRADVEDKSYLKFHPVLSLGLRIRLR